MASSVISFFGGNGHCAARLTAARAFLPPGIDLLEAPYPGFEGRARAASLEAFLETMEEHVREAAPDWIYATGIGGLLALCLRLRGGLREVPILLQGPVLWGLERRWMPRMMRFRILQGALSRTFATAAFQRRFVRKYFTHPPEAATAAAFFAGYARCTALPDFFAWLSPPLLRSLERQAAERPEALERIAVWWGGRDAVVSLRELAWTAAALGPAARWPLRVFPEWGHYPQIEEPRAWAEALGGALADAAAV
jgi:pimeloyl-ACP methyl ester carboxylesterase